MHETHYTQQKTTRIAQNKDIVLNSVGVKRSNNTEYYNHLLRETWGTALERLETNATGIKPGLRWLNRSLIPCPLQHELCK